MPHSAVVAKDVLVGVPYVWAHPAPANTGHHDMAVASAPLQHPQCEVAVLAPVTPVLDPVAPCLAAKASRMAATPSAAVELARALPSTCPRVGFLVAGRAPRSRSGSAATDSPCKFILCVSRA